MSFNLDAFMAGGRDFARGYTFYAKINNSIFDESDKFLVKTTSLPAGTVTPIETNWQGNKYKLGGVQEFTDLNITFNVDPKDEIRHKFVLWQQDIHNPETNMHGDPSQVGGYMSDIELTHVSHISGDTIMKYILHGAWPTSVAEMSLDYASQEVAQFDVTFAYQLHTTE